MIVRSARPAPKHAGPALRALLLRYPVRTYNGYVATAVVYVTVGISYYCPFKMNRSKDEIVHLY